MKRTEMVDDLLRRYYEATIAVADEIEDHREAEELLHKALNGITNALYALGRAAIFSNGNVVALDPATKTDRDKIVDDVFLRLYNETLAIIEDSATTHEQARAALSDTLGSIALMVGI